MEGQGTELPAVSAFARVGGLVRRSFGSHMRTETWAHELGMRPGCFGVLNAVAMAPSPPAQRDLADQLAIDPSDVVGLVDDLEHAGLLVRERDPEDRRRNALSLTDAGREARARYLRVAAAVDEELLGVLDPADRAELRRLLDVLVRAHARGAIADPSAPSGADTSS